MRYSRIHDLESPGDSPLVHAAIVADSPVRRSLGETPGQTHFHNRVSRNRKEKKRTAKGEKLPLTFVPIDSRKV